MHNKVDSLIGSAPAFENVLRAARLVAATDVSTLILGESGTGKEKLAAELHHHSARANKPFISINCAALPDTLAESELFGHRKGAFTGADSHYEGRIRAAAGGTLFLDEVGELPLAVQAKLLRFLESRECQAIGEARPSTVDVRVIAATNRDLAEMVEVGQFRRDLYYRLNVVPLELPPLRERREDIRALLNHFIGQLADHYKLARPRFTQAAIACLRSYHWPGNIRELRNICERLVVLCQGAQVDVTNLPREIRNPSFARNSTPSINVDEHSVSMRDVEKQLIIQALARTAGNRSRAARLLGITRDTLLYRLKKYAIVA